MWVCKNCGQSVDDDLFVCWNCGANENGEVVSSFSKVVDESRVGDFISSEEITLSNTSLVNLYPDLEILGLVCSEIVIGTDIISKLFAEVVNFMGGSSGNYQAYIEQARHQVTQDIIDKALNAKANAIMGIKYDYENIGNGMLMVGVTGTAVRISSEGV
jgi:uncharacterized protein YbjQ (UPF0145 family)